MVENFWGLQDGCVITEWAARGFTGNATRFPENVASIHFAQITHSIVVFSYAGQVPESGLFFTRTVFWNGGAAFREWRAGSGSGSSLPLLLTKTLKKILNNNDQVYVKST